MKTSEKSMFQSSASLFVFARNGEKYEKFLEKRAADRTWDELFGEGHSDEKMFGLSFGSIREKFGNNLILVMDEGDREEIDAYTCEDEGAFGFEVSFKYDYRIIVMTRDGTAFGENAELLTDFAQTFFDRMAEECGAHCAMITIDGETTVKRYPETTVIDACEESVTDYTERKSHESKDEEEDLLLEALGRFFFGGGWDMD